MKGEATIRMQYPSSIPEKPFLIQRIYYIFAYLESQEEKSVEYLRAGRLEE
jgi:hypothetical protein